MKPTYHPDHSTPCRNCGGRGIVVDKPDTITGQRGHVERCWWCGGSGSKSVVEMPARDDE